MFKVIIGLGVIGVALANSAVISIAATMYVAGKAIEASVEDERKSSGERKGKRK